MCRRAAFSNAKRGSLRAIFCDESVRVRKRVQGSQKGSGMYTALYRSERPEVFDEILGQEHIVRILKHQIASGEVSHAYLFCGTRGTGKTTTARILAKGVCTRTRRGDLAVHARTAVPSVRAHSWT